MGLFHAILGLGSASGRDCDGMTSRALPG
jgi:hypothetical protein